MAGGERGLQDFGVSIYSSRYKGRHKTRLGEYDTLETYLRTHGTHVGARIREILLQVVDVQASSPLPAGF